MGKRYRLLLVDDEEEVRQAVIRKLDWDALGYEVVGEASNGQEALEIAESLEPDVIMTDIRMPFMDGLELSRRVRRMLPGARIAILTGFDEFDYAREAISQQVVDYVLKPIDAEELASVFTRIRTSLDEEIESRRDMEKLRRHYQESLPVMRQQALLELLTGNVPAETLREDFALYYGLSLKADAYAAAVVQYEFEQEEGRLLAVSLRELVPEVLADAFLYHVVSLPGRMVILFLLKRTDGIQEINEALRKLFPWRKRLQGLQLHIGIGKIYHRPEDFARSYEDACNALEYQFLMEGGQCIYIGDIEPGTDSEPLPDPSLGEAVIRQIKTGSGEDLRQAVGELIDHLRRFSTSPKQYQVYFMEVFTALLKLIRSYRIDEREAKLDLLLSEGISMQFSDLDALEAWLFEFCENLRHLTRQERKDSIRLLVERAKDILEQHYGDSELSLETVCAQLGVSHAYFSTVFKRETGQGFVGYLTSLRMEKAMELLQGTDEKTYQIAEEIGYADPNYFSYVFKKQFGMSPSKYRGSMPQART